MTEGTTHGARLASADPRDRFALHAAADRRGEFEQYDAVLAGLFDRAIRASDLYELRYATRRADQDELRLNLGEADLATISAVLSPSEQQLRGAWYVPKADRPTVGQIEFAYWAKAEPRFAVSAAGARLVTVKLDTPDTVVTWAALAPIMQRLYLPIKLRSGYWVGDRRPDLMAKDWAQVDATYAALGLTTTPLELFKSGRDWAGLSIDEVIAARQALTAAWAEAPASVGTRAICLMISELTERYYAKAKDGKAQRERVMNKGLERLLTGVFGGDWLAFLRYLDEEPHPAEKVSTAVERTQLIVSSDTRAKRAAAETGVPIEEIRRMMAVYWGGREASPVEQRVEVMSDWWKAFDEIHARQATGRPSLWGLIGDRFEDRDPSAMEEDRRFRSRDTSRAYEMLPKPLLERIEEMWGSAVLPRWPEALVTEPYPHATFAEALGPAAALWHELALTCWFLCEGPYSRTDIGGAPEYYSVQIKTLEDLGCPIDSRLFPDLRDAERKLTPRAAGWEKEPAREVAPGISVSVSVSIGPDKLDGFEGLNAVITSFRQRWMDQHLSNYLEKIWERGVRQAGDAYHRHVADKGKPPTAKQFAKLAAAPANRWFAGDLAGLSASLGLQSPEPQTQRRLLPKDRAAFVSRVRESLGGATWAETVEEPDDEQRTTMHRWSELAEKAPEVVQVWEATGERPTIKGFGWARLRLEAAFGPDLEAGWRHYVDAIGLAVEKPEPEGPEHTTMISAAAPAPALRKSMRPPSEPPSKRRGWLGRLRDL